MLAHPTQERLSGAEIIVRGRALREAEQDGEHPTDMAAVRLLLLTGLRRSEALGLHQRWVDAELQAVRFPDTKTGAQVRPIGRAGLDLIRGQPQRDGLFYVFPLDWGDGHLTAAVLDLERACATARCVAAIRMVDVSTTLVSSMTAARLETGPLAHNSDLLGKRLAAVASSSGAEYLDSQRLPYTMSASRREALLSLASGNADAVVNSVGALEYMISTQFQGVVAMPSGLLAPAYMAFALPLNSPLKNQLDRAVIRVTGSPGWHSLEDSDFNR